MSGDPDDRRDPHRVNLTLQRLADVDGHEFFKNVEKEKSD
jgi:hypothetical protein